MADMGKLRGKIAEKGFTQERLAKCIGIDPATLSRKINTNGSSFSLKQMKDMSEVLGLSDADSIDIFLK